MAVLTTFSASENDEIPFVLPYSRQILTPDEITNTVARILFRPDSKGKLTAIRQPVAQRIIVKTATVDKTVPENKHLQPAQLAFLTPEIPSTLILNQIESDIQHYHLQIAE